MPRAISAPSAASTLTVSPRSKRPRAPVTPAGRRLRPSRSARSAPASMLMAPAGRSVPAIHCLRAAAGVAVGTNQVQSAPSSMRRREGRARVQIATTVLAVIECQQHLGHRHIAALEQLLVGVREADLPDRRRRLALLQAQRAVLQPEPAPPERNGPG